jgi:hypothetical protein
MAEEKPESRATQLAKLATTFLGSPWPEILAHLWKAGRKLLRGLSEEGMYEVLEYESTLELKDKRGEHALFRKRERVRYLQNNIMAYQDHAWADGESLIGYRCTPGVPVDRYQPGRDTYILISLREVKNRGDVDEFNIQWGIKGGFIRSAELWETEICHRTKRLKVQVIFPKERPPLRISLTESTLQKTHQLAPENLIQLPDGRWLISWATSQPRLHERYLLKWDW